MLTQSTGLPLVPSPQSRTRRAADHAGPSPPPVPWREPTKLQATNSPHSLSRNSLTVTILAHKDATVVPWLAPSTGTSPTRPSLNPTTHTPQRPEHATPPTTLESPMTRASSRLLKRAHLLSWLPSKLHQ